MISIYLNAIWQNSSNVRTREVLEESYRNSGSVV